MSEVKTFKAASMQEALAIVRRELGMDAVILRTRHVTRRRLLPFLKKREEVEITAGANESPLGLDISLDAAAPLKQAGQASSITLHTPTEPRQQPAQPAHAHHPAADPVDLPEPKTALDKAVRLAAELERRNAGKARLEASLKSLEAAIAPPAARDSSAKPTASTTATSPASGATSGNETAVRAGASGQAASGTQMASGNQASGLSVVAGRTGVHAGDNGTSELAGKLDALQRMVENLTRSTQLRTHDEVPAELFELYTQLIDADIEDDLSRELIFRLRQSCPSEQLHDTAACRAILSAMVEADLRIASPIRPVSGRRRVVALVGPTGVGKTTTIAKLAANFRLRDGVKMGLVTVDTYRIAAVEQLRTYAEIIDLPMKVVTSPQDMCRALDEMSGLDLVLIDTAGRSPRDELKIQELKQMLGEANVDEAHLVMSLTTSVRGIRMTCEQFAAVNPTALILTKLDEATGAGSLLSVAREVRLPFSYLTTGQDVPEDIEPANASRIARLVLGQDRLFDKV